MRWPMRRSLRRLELQLALLAIGRSVPSRRQAGGGLLRAEVIADGRLADPADLLDGADATALLDDDGAPDSEKVKAAVTELLARKPHYAKRISGDVGQGARPGPGDPNEELWGSSSPGRVSSRRRDHPFRSGIRMIGLPMIRNGYT